LVTIKEIRNFVEDREKNFNKMERRLLNLTIKKFFSKAEEEIIDHELVDYVVCSGLRVGEYDRVAIIYLALTNLLGEDGENYFMTLLSEKNFETVRDLTLYIV
jgi:hypothetical protein